MIRLLTLLTLAACAQPGVNPRDVLSRARLDATGQPTLLAELPELKVAATLAPSGRNGEVITWASGDQASLSFQGGVLVATRGLGADVMSADVTGTLAMLRGRSEGVYTRLNSGLDGEYQTAFRAYQCKRTSARPEQIIIFDRPHSTTRIEETCTTPGRTVTNIYWAGPDGFIWKSRQWVSSHAGYLWTEQLVR